MLIYAVGAKAHGMVIQYDKIMPVQTQPGKLHAEASRNKPKMHELRRTTNAHLWKKCPSAEKREIQYKNKIPSQI